jgi:polyferredoxin
MEAKSDQREVWFSLRNGKIGPVHRKGWLLYAALFAVFFVVFVSSFFWPPSLMNFAVAGSVIATAVFVFLILTIRHFGKQPS